jgi:hypothetical protein
MYCKEPKEFVYHEIPEIVRNKVQILDMNFIARNDVVQVLKTLGDKRVDGKVVYYELVCGIDYRFLTPEVATALKEHRFIRPRIAWDGFFKDQKKIKVAIDTLTGAGFRNLDVMVFILCNWRVPYFENVRKLDLCKIWRVKICDCYFDGQVFPDVHPEYWTTKECVAFRKAVRKHNLMVIFGIDPDVKSSKPKLRSNVSKLEQVLNVGNKPDKDARSE